MNIPKDQPACETALDSPVWVKGSAPISAQRESYSVEQNRADWGLGGLLR